MVPKKLSLMRTSHLRGFKRRDLGWYGTNRDSSFALSSLVWGRMGGNTYFQYDCVIYIFILGLMILVITYGIRAVLILKK